MMRWILGVSLYALAFFGMFSGGSEDMILAISPGLALIGSSLIGAGGNVAGGLLAKPDKQRVSDLNTVQPRPETDPVLSALSVESLLQLGVAPDQILEVFRQSSPLQQLQTQILESATIKNKTKLRLIRDLSAAVETGEFPDRKKPARMKRLNEALALGGFSSLDELRSVQSSFDTQLSQFVAQAQPLSSEIRGGREAALSGIASLQQDFPLVTQTRFNQVLDEQRQLLREQALESANVARINPATKLLQTENAALTRALQLLQGQQALGSQGIAGLQASLAPPEALAQNVSAQRTNASLGSSQIAGQQALALNNLAVQQALGGGSVGTGVAAAGGQIASTGQLFGLIDLLKQKQPGTAPALGNAFLQNPNDTFAAAASLLQ